MIKNQSHFTFIILILSILLLSFNSMDDNKTISDFNLLNVDGKMVSLNDYPEAKGFIIVFTCNHCPFAKLYPERLNALNSKYKTLGVQLIAISSTDTLVYEEDSFSEMVKKAQHERFNFPYLFDGMQTVAKNFNAQKTPHAFVLWKKNNSWIVKYNGAIDDNGAEPEKVNNRYIAKAVDALLIDKEVEIKETKSVGCQIHFRK